MRPNKSTLLALPLAILAFQAAPLFGDEHDKKTDVTISEPVQVPGGVVLPPGKYMFILNDSTSSRHIVEIKSEDGSQLYAMMFTARATRRDRTSHAVLTFYEMPAGQPPALREWFWPGDIDGQAFLYPHSEAGTINQAGNQTAPEVSDQEFNNLIDQGFSTRYPASSSTSTNSGEQPEPPSRPHTHVVPDPGAESGR